MIDDPCFLTLKELARLLDERALTSREIVEAYVERIVRLDDRLHAFVDVWGDAALAGADAADLERRAGATRGALHGLPIALKDLLHVAGHVTTAGSKTWLDLGSAKKAAETATAVERLLAAGMIPLGKTHMVEFAFGGWGRNEPMGAPWNPWDTSTHRVAGGSSSGSAVAVAASLAPAAIGSDTGGSIRIPAALCGLTGLKPTYGAISLSGVVPLATTLDSLGPITRTVDDAALLFGAMAGPDPKDAATLSAPQHNIAMALATAPDVRGMRITTLTAKQLPEDIDADVVRVWLEAIDVLRDLGAVVIEEPCPIDFEDLMVRNGRIIAAEAWTLHRAYIEDPALPIDPWVRRRVISGKTIGAADYIDELTARKQIVAEFTQWIRGRDALLTPTLPIAATALIDVDESKTPLAMFTRVANYLATCAITLPAGLSKPSRAVPALPIGVQLLAAPFAEGTLIRAGRAFQLATPWHTFRPDLSAWESPRV